MSCKINLNFKKTNMMPYFVKNVGKNIVFYGLCSHINFSDDLALKIIFFNQCLRYLCCFFLSIF